MLLIQSNLKDPSTDDVEDWICYMNPEFKVKRINNQTRLKSYCLRINGNEFSSSLLTENGEAISSNSVGAFWYRRGSFLVSIARDSLTTDISSVFSGRLSAQYNRENAFVLDVINNTLARGKALNNHKENFINKLNTLKEALSCGLRIPDTIVTNDYKQLQMFADWYPQILTKDIHFDAFEFQWDKETTVQVEPIIKVLSSADIKKYEQRGCGDGQGALFQEYISKKYELRIFFLSDQFYSMAIFSQGCENTEIDSRNFDNDRPPRCVPFNLPVDIKKKLNSLNARLGLNSGSIDMIVTPEGDYIFLEVNPIGQFQFLSKTCNYDIEKQIATYLISENGTTRQNPI